MVKGDIAFHEQCFLLPQLFSKIKCFQKLSVANSFASEKCYLKITNKCPFSEKKDVARLFLLLEKQRVTTYKG